MAGATAFFTTFALPPIVFILAQLFGLFVGRGIVGRGLIEHISNTLGKDGADQVRQVIRSIHNFSNSWYVIVFGFVFLVFVSTTLFSVIRSSLNQIWQIRVKERPGFFFAISTRARSFAAILLVGVLFFADLLFESLEMTARKYIDGVWTGGGFYVKTIISEVASVVIVAAWLIMLFRFLADGTPSWKASMIGGVLTGILFTAGRLLLRYLLVHGNVRQLYGPSGSLVLVLLFVFYSSFIFYYGASFIAVYSEKKQWRIMPNSKSYSYRVEKMQ